MSSGVVDKIREQGGEIYAITSEPQTLASRAKEEWELSFDTIGDPHHEISNACQIRDWLDIHVKVDEEDFLQIPVDGMDFEAMHPKGYFQAGVLVVNQAGRVLYRWKQVPTHANVGGALERPTAEHVWSQVEEKLGSGEDLKDTGLDLNPKLDAKSPPWPLFVCALLGNGWFMGPVPFGQLANGPSAQERIQRAFKRFAGFVVAWIAALILLPTLPVLIALALWGAWITPKVMMVNRSFQHVERSEA